MDGGEDQDKHLEEMPFGAFGFLSQEMADRFEKKYGYLRLNFLFSTRQRRLRYFAAGR